MVSAKLCLPKLMLWWVANTSVLLLSDALYFVMKSNSLGTCSLLTNYY